MIEVCHWLQKKCISVLTTSQYFFKKVFCLILYIHAAGDSSSDIISSDKDDRK